MKLILVLEGITLTIHNYFLFRFDSFLWGNFYLVFLIFSIYRSRSRSRSYSPSYAKRYSRSSHSDDILRSKPKTPKIEYITEFGGSGDADATKREGFSPPRSPTSRVDTLNRSEHWTFNYCQDRLDSLFSAKHITHIVAWANFCG